MEAHNSFNALHAMKPANMGVRSIGIRQILMTPIFSLADTLNFWLANISTYTVVPVGVPIPTLQEA